MLHNKKGAALLQVLLVTVVLAGMATMLLRANLSRTTTSRQTRRMVSNQMLINACQAEINALWSLKDADTFAEDLSNCDMYMDKSGSVWTHKKIYKCKPVDADGVRYQVKAEFTGTAPDTTNGLCRIEYTVTPINEENIDYPAD